MKHKITLAIMLITTCIACSGCQNNEHSSQIAKGTIETVTDFYSPELDKSFTITIYLPPNYATSDINYPVIYMFDGQNLFDSETATYHKEWQIDESLDSLYAQNKTEGFIVVGADSFKNRTVEYNLYMNNTSNGIYGKAPETAEFYTNTLKTYIDENYRTLPDKENTGIIGASYGAVVTACTSISYTDTYGFIGLYSYYDNQSPYKMRDYITENVTTSNFADTPIYFCAASCDFAKKSTEIAYQTATDNGLTHITYEIAEGEHDEYSWGSHFISCLEFWGWLANK